MSDWIRLKTGNDWGKVYYAIEPNEPSSHGFGYANSKRGIRLEQGEPVRVRMRDGHELDARIALREVQNGYSDHGHEHRVTSQLVLVAIDFHGQVFSAPITEFEVSEAWARSKGAR